MMTWVPGAARHTIPNITHGKGVYLFDDQGNQYLDWTSQAICANLGHDLPESIVQAAAQQMRDLPFIYGGIGVPEVRTRLNQLMAELLPGDLRVAVFPSSGAEANEAGIMMARRYTGRHKVLGIEVTMVPPVQLEAPLATRAVGMDPIKTLGSSRPLVPSHFFSRWRV
jgi:4-aminobutyrate aminotransferase-like enzyme